MRRLLSQILQSDIVNTSEQDFYVNRTKRIRRRVCFYSRKSKRPKIKSPETHSCQVSYLCQKRKQDGLENICFVHSHHVSSRGQTKAWLEYGRTKSSQGRSGSAVAWTSCVWSHTSGCWRSCCRRLNSTILWSIWTTWICCVPTGCFQAGLIRVLCPPSSTWDALPALHPFSSLWKPLQGWRSGTFHCWASLSAAKWAKVPKHGNRR